MKNWTKMKGMKNDEISNALVSIAMTLLIYTYVIPNTGKDL